MYFLARNDTKRNGMRKVVNERSLNKENMMKLFLSGEIGLILLFNTLL